jgi:hypothetical protein
MGIPSAAHTDSLAGNLNGSFASWQASRTMEERALALGMAVVWALSLTGCGSDDKEDPGPTGGSQATGGSQTSGGSNNMPSAGKPSGTGGTAPIGGGKSSAADLARKLGREPNFLIGMGNDLPSDYVWENSGIYKLGAPLDLHYIYLAKGWQDWNAGGMFPQIIGNVDKGKGAIPMSSVYAMTGLGENNLTVLTDEAYMSDYWANAKLLVQRYAELNVPTLIHLEPDFWAFAQQKAAGDPSTLPARLSPDCGDLPGDVSGMARCWFKLAHAGGSQVMIGLHASEWGGSPDQVGDFLKKLGAAESDVVFIDMLDRDAGCFEDAKLPQCMRPGAHYLDETNQTSPNYSERLAFAKTISTVTGKPIMWWQLPFGVPSDTPGGTPGHFRDNKVHYIFSHIQEFVDAGGIGAAFGTGAGDQTTPDTDDGQFKAAVQAYYQAPVPLP